MDESRMDSNTWLHTATKGIRFGPDREAVSRELLEHIEDKTVDLMRIFPDMSWDEARQRALDDMGDPAEIGRDLARVHRPWLGWLWRFSQVVLVVTSVVVVIEGSLALLGGGTGWFRSGEGLEPRVLESGIARIEYLEPCPDRDVVDGHWITMPQAAVMEWKSELRLGVVLRSVSPYFWERESRNLRHRIRAVDSLGNQYPSYEERWGTWGDNVKEWMYVSGSPDGRGPFHRDYVVWVHGIDPSAEWVRLEYDWLGRSFSMTVDVKEAGA